MKRAKLVIVIGFIAIILSISIFCFISFDVYLVKGNSMYPSLQDGDIVIVHNTKKLENGDIIVIDSTELMGISDYNYIIKRYCEKKSTFGIFVLGDNEEDSIDSLDFGEVPNFMLKGKVIATFYK